MKRFLSKYFLLKIIFQFWIWGVCVRVVSSGASASYTRCSIDEWSDVCAVMMRWVELNVVLAHSMSWKWNFHLWRVFSRNAWMELWKFNLKYFAFSALSTDEKWFLTNCFLDKRKKFSVITGVSKVSHKNSYNWWFCVCVEWAP